MSLLVFTSDKKKLLTHFNKEPVLFSYHIGDLDEYYFDDCQWGATYGRSPRIDDVVLVFRGLETPSVLAFGLTDKFDGLLDEMLELLPGSFFCHFQERSRSAFKKFYNEKPLGKHFKMKLSSECPEVKLDDYLVRPLEVSDEEALRELLLRAYPGNYFHSRMLVRGNYIGCYDNNKLIAVSGVHVDSDEYKISVLGNITTDETYRGKGIATALTSVLAGELQSKDRTVCLNVKTDNHAAIRCYEKLGFERVHEYEEAFFSLKE